MDVSMRFTYYSLVYRQSAYYGLSVMITTDEISEPIDDAFDRVTVLIIPTSVVQDAQTNDCCRIASQQMSDMDLHSLFLCLLHWLLNSRQVPINQSAVVALQCPGTLCMSYFYALVPFSDLLSSYRFYSASACNADRCNCHGRSVSLSVCRSVRHVPVFCPEKWKCDRAVF